jgi:hypothetical protein
MCKQHSKQHLLAISVAPHYIGWLLVVNEGMFLWNVNIISVKDDQDTGTAESCPSLAASYVFLRLSSG